LAGHHQDLAGASEQCGACAGFAGNRYFSGYGELVERPIDLGATMLNRYYAIRIVTLAASMLWGAALLAQTATGTINTTLVNKSGISLVFNTAPGSVNLGNSGTSAASA